PIKAVEALTVNIDSQDLLLSDLLSVTWTGAPGTAAGGSHTTPARPISETTLTIELPVTVLAFNLGKTVTVTYTVTRNGAPRTSLPLLLKVGTLPDSSLILPVIMDADDDGAGSQFDVSKLTANATYRMGVWPLIATGQYVWLRLKGTNADGSDYNLQIHTAPGSMVSAQWLNQGYYERSIAFAGLRNLKDGSPLTMEFKAAFGKSTDESEAVVFPVRTYTIKALEDVRPEITRVEDSKGNEILPGGTTGDTSITLEGTGAVGQEVEIFEGATSTGKKPKADDKGIWTVELTGLTTTTHLFKAKALYGSGTESEVWTLTVVYLVDLVEAFGSYPRSKPVSNPRESIEGTHTKITVITNIGGWNNNCQVPGPAPNRLSSALYLSVIQNTFAYSLALKQGSAHRAIISGSYSAKYPFRIRLEFLQKNDVVCSIPFFEGIKDGEFERDVAPDNGRVFDAIKFVYTNMTIIDYSAFLDIYRITFRS
ncbi:hypothetical protein ACTZGP_27290, partial [Pseudomonas putida]